MGFKLVATILILSLFPNTPLSQWLLRRPPPLPVNPKPLCAFQLALVNRACALLPYAQVPPPTPPSPAPVPPPPAPEEGQAGGHHHSHRQHHRRRHHHGQHQHRYVTAEEQECCRWLKTVDTVCVCDLLVHLPPFMTRPLHQYKVIVNDTCDVSFDCPSRLVKL